MNSSQLYSFGNCRYREHQSTAVVALTTAILLTPCRQPPQARRLTIIAHVARDVAGAQRLHASWAGLPVCRRHLFLFINFMSPARYKEKGVLPARRQSPIVAWGRETLDRRPAADSFRIGGLQIFLPQVGRANMRTGVMWPPIW